MRCYFGTKPGSIACNYCLNLQCSAIYSYRKFLIRNIYKYLKQYRSCKCKHALCHSFKCFESGTQVIDMLYMSHATKPTVLQSAAVTGTQSNNIRLSRFAWTTYAKSLGKICYTAGVHNTGPAGQMWPAISSKMARKRFTECSQCFSR